LELTCFVHAFTSAAMRLGKRKLRAFSQALLAPWGKRLKAWRCGAYGLA